MTSLQYRHYSYCIDERINAQTVEWLAQNQTAGRLLSGSMYPHLSDFNSISVHWTLDSSKATHLEPPPPWAGGPPIIPAPSLWWWGGSGPDYTSVLDPQFLPATPCAFRECSSLRLPELGSVLQKMPGMKETRRALIHPLPWVFFWRPEKHKGMGRWEEASKIGKRRLKTSDVQRMAISPDAQGSISF